MVKTFQSKAIRCMINTQQLNPKDNLDVCSGLVLLDAVMYPTLIL